MNFRFDIIYEYRWMFLYGALATLGISAISTVAGTVMGLLGALMRLANPEKGGILVKLLAAICRGIVTIYVNFFRGTPLFVQILIWHYVWVQALINPTDGLLLSGSAAAEFRKSYAVLTAGVLSLTFNSGAYITEIFRAGIQSIDRGQMEAARSSGLTYAQAMRYVIVPQALRRMLPPLSNEFITLLKDSSLLAAIAFPELNYVQKTITGRYYTYKEALFTISIIYLIMTLGLTWWFSKMEKKYNVANKR